MKRAEEFRDALWQTITGAGMSEVRGDIKLMRFGMLDQILRRDAEWEAKTRSRDAEIRRDAFEAGYAQGHNDTVEGCARDMYDAANDYIAAITGEEE